MFPLSDSISLKKFPLLNFSLIIFIIFVFIKQITSPDLAIFIRDYALIPARVNFSDSSTLLPFLTAIFLHAGFLHIISNLWFLWIFGDNVEDHLGWFLFPILFVVSGVVGNLVQYLLMPDSNIPMLGASGAVAGILGAYYVLFPQAKIKTLVLIFLFPFILNIPAAFMLGYWFILQILSGAASLPFMGVGGIAFWAHVGGFLTGVIFASLFKRP